MRDSAKQILYTLVPNPPPPHINMKLMFGPCDFDNNGYNHIHSGEGLHVNICTCTCNTNDRSLSSREGQGLNAVIQSTLLVSGIIVNNADLIVMTTDTKLCVCVCMCVFVCVHVCV